MDVVSVVEGIERAVEIEQKSFHLLLLPSKPSKRKERKRKKGKKEINTHTQTHEVTVQSAV